MKMKTMVGRTEKKKTVVNGSGTTAQCQAVRQIGKNMQRTCKDMQGQAPRLNPTSPRDKLPVHWH